MNAQFASFFTPTQGYLAACTAGLPSLRSQAAMHAFIETWAKGKLNALALTDSVERSRAWYAQIAGTIPERVAIGSQVSQLVSVIATGVPDNGTVLVAEGDFASLAHPFTMLNKRGVTVQYAKVTDLAEAIHSGTDLVVFSLVQSATGEIADYEAIVSSAKRTGTRTCVDLSQSLGWLPVGAEPFDYTVCHAYKWLCSPRGTAFLTVREGLDDTLTPLAAGWCSADNPWESCYASNMPLAMEAGRFDLSPVWPSVEGTEAALEFIATIRMNEVHAHAVNLANHSREILGLASSNSAIVTWPDAAGSDLVAMERAGIHASGRAGNARIAFHLWNDESDLTLLAQALGK